MSAALPSAIAVADLTKRYGDRTVVDGLSFEVARGEVFGILGPNGAGKTTTVEILEGYRRPDGGSVSVLGYNPFDQGNTLRERMGVMLQDGGLFPGIRPLEILNLYAAFYPAPDDPNRLLDEVGLREVVRTPVRRLSGGQYQRLSLALALIGRPELLFLDEPTAGMDPHARATTWELIRTQIANGVTIVLTTHAMDEAEQLCDRLAIMDRGRMVALGTPAEITAGTDGEFLTFVTQPGIDLEALAMSIHLDRGTTYEVRPGEYEIRANVSPVLVAGVAGFLADHEILLLEMRAGRRSLEEVFLRLTSEDSN